MDGDANNSRRWTCQACGCNTNQSSDRTCSVCGTSDGPSLLRRSGYAARAGIFARSVAARRAYMEDELGFDDEDPLERVEDVDMAVDDEDDVVAALAMEVAGVPSVGRFQESRRQRLLDAARSFGMLSGEFQRINPDDLLRAATENAPLYQPKWETPSQVSGRTRSGTGIVVGDGDRQNVAHLPLGVGEGRALRAAEPLPRAAGFSSFTLSPTGNPSSLDRRHRRAFGFRVAFDHPRRDQGRSMGGCYLVGITTASFTSFSERNGLQQSPYFWGIEDGGSKFEGSRHAPARSVRRGPSHHAVEVLPNEAPRNADNVLFGCREVVSVVVDLESRSLTFWRNETLLGTLVTNLPRGSPIFPVVVPFNAGVTVAITSMNADPIPFLQTFVSDWRQTEMEKDMSQRRKLAEHREVLIQNRRPTVDLVAVLRNVFSWYAEGVDESVNECQASLSFVSAARLWYRCDMKLSSLYSLMETKGALQNTNSEPLRIFFDDFLDLVIRVIEEEEALAARSDYGLNERSELCQVGDKVELAEGYERFGDASNGPLHPGNRGTVVEVQHGPNGERHSVRVLFNGRRWWYQPQALLSECSGLTESPAVWFLRTILRAHSYDHTTLQPLWGNPLTSSSWQVGDIVSAGTAASSASGGVHNSFGRIVAETSLHSSNSLLAACGRDSDSVLVEFVNESFGEATGVLSAEPAASSLTLYTRRVRLNRLVHSRWIDATDSDGHVPHSVDVSNQQIPTSSSFSATGSCPQRPGALISTKLKGLLNGLGQVDIASVEELTTECGKNVGALANAFSEGLPELFVAALDKVSLNPAGRNSTQTLVALGDLAVCVANQIYHLNGFEGLLLHDNEKSRSSTDEAVRHVKPERISSVSAILRQTRNEGDHVHREVFGSTSAPPIHHNGVNDLNSRRLSSMQQRRSMLLALMSRARRGGGNAVDERDIAGAAGLVSGASHSQHNTGDRSPFAFAGPGRLPSERNWEDHPHERSFSDNAIVGRDNFFNHPSLPHSNAVPGTQSSEVVMTPRILDSILRGQGEAQAGSRSAPGIVSTPTMIKSLINNGLLGNNLLWVQATVAGHSERNSVGSSCRENSSVLLNAVDEEGNSLLMLAISLGCSESIIRYLISHGAPVSEKELKSAALTSQPHILLLLLDHCAYVHGMIDLKHCSQAVRSVLEAAASGQAELENNMRSNAEEFFPLVINRLLQIGLSARRLPSQSGQTRSKSVALTLVGNVLLNALQDHQNKTFPVEVSGAASETNDNTHANSLTDSGRFPPGASSLGLRTASGLLDSVPGSILKQALFQHVDGSSPPLITYLLLVEDFLCSKIIDDVGVGLALLSLLLKHFPSLGVSALMDNFGFSELVSFHEAFAVTRFAQVSAYLASVDGGDRSDESRRRTLDVDQPGPPRAILCPRDHPASLHITRHSSFRCDLCGKAVERGRPMHGCRECDWDACEQCTDKAECGIVKWTKIKEMSIECQQLLLADDEALLETGQDPAGELLQPIHVNWKCDISELAKVSTQILQHDSEALKHLSIMLEAPGRITFHQFVNIILSSLHSSLVGRSELCRPRGFGPRCKKAKVVAFPCRDVDDICPAFNGGHRQFCKLALEYLVESGGNEMRTTQEAEAASKSQRDDENDDEDDESDDENKVQSAVDIKTSLVRIPELIRRLHQVLSLYESLSMVKSLPGHSPRSSQGGSNGGDLQALTKPLELMLFPSAFGRCANAESQLRHVTVLVEPLTSMLDVERLVLCSFRIVNPSYVAFCQRLATDKAVIAEKSSCPNSASKPVDMFWRLACVEGYDEEIGAHHIRYASGLLRGDDIGVPVFDLEAESLLDLVIFDGHKASVVLAAREFVVLHRQASGEFKARERRPPTNVDFLVSDVDATFSSIPDSPFASYVGARVESTAGLDGTWRSHTVIAIASIEHALSEKPYFTLVSDEGYVHYNVSLSQIRGVDASLGNRSPPSAARERIERAFSGDSVFENRASLSRAFPFVSVRRENVDARRLPQGNNMHRAGILKRTWSALSPIEAMNPLELNSFGEDSSVKLVPNQVGRCRCSIGEQKVDVLVGTNGIEHPPSLRVRFGASHTVPTSDVAGDTTLIAGLRQLYLLDERTRDQPFFAGQSCRLFFSIEVVQQRFDQRRCTFPVRPLEALHVSPLSSEAIFTPSNSSLMNSTWLGLTASEPDMSSSWLVPSRSRKLSLSNLRSDDDVPYSGGLCEGLDEVCIQCMDIINLLAENAEDGGTKDGVSPSKALFESTELTQKLLEQLEDPLIVVGGSLPDWCTVAPSYAPRVFSYESRKLLLGRAAFGVSRSALRQQEAKVNVGPLRKRMAALRGRAVELVGEAFSGGADDPTALQLQADELYGMEEALAARVKASFRAQRWDERALQVAKASVRRESLLLDAAAVMARYANDPKLCRRRLEVRFDGESGFDAASGDEAGVTRGFYADVAEALLSCDHVTGAFCSNACASPSGKQGMFEALQGSYQGTTKLPLWIPDMDASGQVVIPTPRADPKSGLGVYPRPLAANHFQMKEVLVQFRFIGRLFAAALRDGFMFPVPLSAAFLKLVQQVGPTGQASTPVTFQNGSSSCQIASNESNLFRSNHRIADESENRTPGSARDFILSSSELPRPGFLGGDVFAVEMHICRALDDIDENDPPSSGSEVEKRYQALAADKRFARIALGKSFDCSFEEYFQDRTFVDPLDQTQGELASPLCPKGHEIPVTIYNAREWVALAKQFILHDGVVAQARAFRDGVEDFFPSEFLRVFTPDEVQRDVCGVGDNVDNWDEEAIRKLFKLDGGKGAAEALVAVASIGGEGGGALSRRFGQSSPTVTYLVKALSEASPKQRRQFLSFVTSVPIVTPGLIEVVPMIAPTGEFLPMRDPACLPRANTCARRLYLPKFESFESFSEVLWAVVREESKFKGFYEWRG